MVRRKEILICNPRPKDYAPLKTESKRKKRRNSSSSPKNQTLLEKVTFLHHKLNGNLNLSPEDFDYIDIKLRLILNKVSNIS